MSNKKVDHAQLMAQLQAELMLIKNATDEQCASSGLDRAAALKSVHNAMMAIDNVRDDDNDGE